ncbi:hypothetical protein OZX74_03910 [Bifidobacterium sp. ESL0798]|nr:hypothetical protein [Bifidobacterium sp. ESL0798]WEV74672.1 hypothetical protein OZX74_03910 [Bifidobacterium sp. ESL0798]
MNGLLHTWTPIVVLVLVVVIVMFIAGLVVIAHQDIYEGLD